MHCTPAVEHPVPVSWSDLELAFEFVSSSAHEENRAYLCKQTSKIYWRSDLLGDEEEGLPDDVEDSDQYIEIPHKKELGLGKPLVLDFARQFLPDDFEKVRQIFRQRGAYSRFKDLLEYRKAVDLWHEFEAKREEEALRAWCEENSIEIGE
jgi:hypothetical protein